MIRPACESVIPDMKKIAIIGAGIAGLSCAWSLQGAGHDITVFEKSRGLGGRVATRRRETGKGQPVAFDHGAQFFTARKPEFLETLSAVGAAVSEWRPLTAGAERLDGPLLVGTPGMTGIAKGWIADDDIRLGCRIVDIRQSGAGRALLDEEGGSHGPYDHVVLAVPVDQAIPLAAAADCDSRTLAALGAVTMAPCWAGLFAFDTALPAGFDFWSDATGKIVTVATRNASKPGRDGIDCWVVHAAAGWTRDNLERDAGDVAGDLFDAFAEVTGKRPPKPVYATAHRWRFARTETALGKPFLIDRGAGLSFCGDWCLGARVEAAFESGSALAASLPAASMDKTVSANG